MDCTVRYPAAAAGLAAVLVLATSSLHADVSTVDGHWTQAAPLPDARTEVSVATDGERIFLAGGFTQVGDDRARAPRTVYVYDPDADAWEALTELPAGVNHAGVEYHDGKLYVVAGYRENTFEPIDDLRIRKSGVRTDFRSSLVTVLSWAVAPSGRAGAADR